ncbi:MAG: SUF system Fe-S cluster assembly protein [Deltaproteobacteria bacterium]|nr:SUF system Fe-S cluster assembly protein [Deltaproteobacteria bacterium]
MFGWGKKAATKMESLNETVIEAQVYDALRTCFDPEIPVNIYELGLIYEVHVNETGVVDIRMTLTSPHCPAVQSMPAEIEGKVKAIPGVTEVKIDLVWEPPWDQSKMSEAARLQLGMM